MTAEARRALLALALSPVGVTPVISGSARAELTRLRYLRKNGEITPCGLNVADRLFQASAFDL
jgi:hypothetical protein